MLKGLADANDAIDFLNKLSFHFSHDFVVCTGPNGKIVDTVINPSAGQIIDEICGNRERGENDIFVLRIVASKLQGGMSVILIECVCMHT